MNKENLYHSLRYETSCANPGLSWIGNLRWHAIEEKVNQFSFECMSALPSMSHSECVAAKMKKKLFCLRVLAKNATKWIYGADYIENDKFKVIFPFHEYGCIIESQAILEIRYEGHLERNGKDVIIQSGEYWIAFHTDANVAVSDHYMMVDLTKGGRLTVAFDIKQSTAEMTARKLDSLYKNILNDNVKFWNDYLASCPIVPLKEEFDYQHPTLPIHEHYTSEEFEVRQLWHWWCLLVNVVDVRFNKFHPYLAPDQPNWLGAWSNDVHQSMAALSLTNQKELARKLMITYLTHAMNTEGVLCWYIHADGVPCYGTEGDVGRLSHGAPYSTHMIEYYIRNTGDTSILSEEADGITLYERLRRYIYNLHPSRDCNGDSLIEWSNLWETGWDDKGGTFFQDASLEEWMDVVSNAIPKEVDAFYQKNQRPVIAIVEQVIALWSLDAMQKLAEIQGDTETKEYCAKIYAKMIETVSELCWNEEDGFYYDIDVKTGTQTTEKCADAFFWLHFEKNEHRRQELLRHMNDVNEFNCYYIPMLSKDSAGFNPLGYWSGGHWPREVSMMAMGLKRSGFEEKAWEILVRAIMSESGNVIAEVINPLDGKRSTKITKMACAVMNMLALQDITGGTQWF